MRIIRLYSILLYAYSSPMSNATVIYVSHRKAEVSQGLILSSL